MIKYEEWFNSEGVAKSSSNSLIYNEEALSAQLKGRIGKEVLKILGEPAVKKPDAESSEDSGYWWYNLLEAGVFVYFKDGVVTRISVLTENERSKKL